MKFHHSSGLRKNHLPVLLHHYAKSIIQHQLSLRGEKSISSTAFKKRNLQSLLFSLSLLTAPWLCPTSDHGHGVLVCLRCRCQSWCRTKGSIELVTSHEYFTPTAERPAERMSADWSSACVNAQAYFIVYMYVFCSLDGKWQINVNSCLAEQKQTTWWARAQPQGRVSLNN